MADRLEGGFKLRSAAQSTLNIEQPEQLLEYLEKSGHITHSERIDIRVLSGGVSNRTVLVGRKNRQDWVIKQALAKLRTPVDWFSSPERIHREAEGMRWLIDLAPPGSVPALVFEDRRHHLLAMEAVPQPHRNWKRLLLKGELRDDHIQQFGYLLAAIHRNAYQIQDEIQVAFADRSFFDSLRLEPYYQFTAERISEAKIFLSELIRECQATRISLVHGDYSPKNILIWEGRLVLLDHEAIHFGEPAFDVGFSMTHLLSKANHVAQAHGEFEQAALLYWETYADGMKDVAWLKGLELRAVRHTIGCLLARVDGRSPLEYLSPQEQRRQRSAALSLMQNPPDSMPELVHLLTSGLAA